MRPCNDDLIPELERLRAEIIARLTQGAGGTGLLQVMDAGGTPMVEGSVEGGLGIVLAFPMSNKTLPSFSNFIQGRR